MSKDHRSYGERVARGRPVVSFTLPVSTVEELKRICAAKELNKSAVVDLAIRELGKKTTDRP